MKKISVLIIALLLVASVGFADTVGSGVLQVFGMISSVPVNFVVNQTSIARIDLIANTAVQPSGDGVVIGNWVFTASNAVDPVPYRVTYGYSPMAYLANSIAYEVVEINGATSAVRQTGDEIGWTAPVGSSSVTRDIGVRLTTAGAATASSAPASEDYTSIITITLIAD